MGDLGKILAISTKKVGAEDKRTSPKDRGSSRDLVGRYNSLETSATATRVSRQRKNKKNIKPLKKEEKERIKIFTLSFWRTGVVRKRRRVRDFIIFKKKSTSHHFNS